MDYRFALQISGLISMWYQLLLFQFWHNKFPFLSIFTIFFICKIILTKLLLVQINIHQKVFGKIYFFKVSFSLNKQFLWSMYFVCHDSVLSILIVALNYILSCKKCNTVIFKSNSSIKFCQKHVLHCQTYKTATI